MFDADARRSAAARGIRYGDHIITTNDRGRFAIGQGWVVPFVAVWFFTARYFYTHGDFIARALDF